MPPASITFNGHPFDEGDFASALRAQIRQAARHQIGGRLDGLRCPEHGRVPELGDAGDDLVNVRTCCAALDAQVRLRLGAAAADSSGDTEDNVALGPVPEEAGDAALTMDDAPDDSAATEMPLAAEPPLAFISHTSADKARLVRPLADALEARGIRVWLDERDLFIGDNLVKGIFHNGIGKADAVIVVVSKNTPGKSWVEAELTTAYALHVEGHLKHLLPIVLDDQRPPVELRAIVWLPLVEPFDFDAAATRIANSILRTKPAPLGPLPTYTEVPILGLVGLEPDDERLFVFACEQLLERPAAHPIVDLRAVAERAKSLGMSVEHIAEAIGVLDQRGWLTDARRYSEDRDMPSTARVAPWAFERYLLASRATYSEERRRIVGAIVNEHIGHSRALVATLGVHEYIVDHVLEELECEGHVIASHHSDGIDVMSKPTLTRLLRTLT